jgi:S-adenosylmethionine-diacylgycerolhomoserine-N-methlytransferase
MTRPGRILEIGCGTGSNLVAMAERFPVASITGLDLSKEMLDRARCKVARFGSRMTLLHRPYDAPVATGEKFDLIVLSYALSMINPGYDEVLRMCKSDLSATGIIAVVDFHRTRTTWFRRWMAVNHVRMEGQIIEELDKHFQHVFCRVCHGYGTLWRYMLFIGK